MRPPCGVALSLAVLLFAQAGQAQTAAKEAAPPPADLPPGVSAVLWRLSVPASLAPTPERVLLGEKLFNGKARCNTCHAGNVVSPLFSDQKFHNIGIAAHKQDFVKLAREALKVVRTGDEQQIDELALQTRFSELGRFLVTKQENDVGAFKTPTLRNIAITYGAFSDRDKAIWAASTEQFVDEGHRVFHDAQAIGGTVGISCGMCHPDASNTHPETYPKYQVQLGRVALLRDMINWCIENPARGKPLADGDPRMRAMEAYIYAKRKGVKLEYGKK
ncbi:hypothetical protein [Myxococcus sp. SDU36]|uniref:hypothetical protein n=1 Tax=Myxococcus sp. SDU36 TaxID=2831967 RepID=UPI0025431103|nr:hypothetical protein [Myxococcus sp. SDU36]